MHKFHKFTLAWNSTCFGQFLCPSSGVYSLYTQQWYMSYRNYFHPGPARKLSTNLYDIPLLSVRWINSWWTEELSETCRVSCQNKFVKLVHLVGFIIKEKRVNSTFTSRHWYILGSIPNLEDAFFANQLITNCGLWTGGLHFSTIVYYDFTLPSLRLVFIYCR